MSTATPSTLVGLLDQRASDDPDRLAVSFLSDGETQEERLTNHALYERSAAVAEMLADEVPPGERALLLFPAGLDFLAALFGCLQAGVIAVPVAVPSTPQRLQQELRALAGIAADCAPQAVLSTSTLLPLAKTMAPSAPGLDGLRWLAVDGLSTTGAATPPATRATSPDDVAFLQYTSGSTSAPRGVVARHRNVMANLAAAREATRQDRQGVCVMWLPHHHDMGLGGLLGGLYGSYPCYWLAPMAFLERPLRWLHAISRYRGTWSGGPNFAYDLCVRRATPEDIEQLDLSSWEVAANGAEPVRAETVERFTRTFAPSGLRAETLMPSYGLAESIVFVSAERTAPRTLRVDGESLARGEVADAHAGARQVRTLVGCGRPSTGHDVAVMDEHGVRCPADRIGEVWVRGPSVADGYWNRPDNSQEVFGARSADGEGPYLRTGDLGFVRDGQLYIAGRAKDLVIIGGVNHYPQDIEHTIDGAHPGIRPGSTAVFAVNAEGERLVTTAEARDGADGEAVCAAIREAVADEHGVTVDGIGLLPPRSAPKTSSGKIRRNACRDLWLAGTDEFVTHWSSTALARALAAARHEVGSPGPEGQPTPAGNHQPTAPEASDAPAGNHQPTASNHQPATPEASDASELEASDAPAGNHQPTASNHQPATPEASDASELEVSILERLASVLGEAVPVDAPLTSLGLGSLEAAEVKAALEGVGIDVPLSQLLQGWSVRDVAEDVGSNGRSNGARGAAASAGSSYERFVNPAVGSLLRHLRLDRRYVRGEGCWLFDEDERAYLDAVGGYGAVALGHNPPELWEALTAVRASGEPGLVQPAGLEAAGELAERLLGLAPAGLAHVTFTNSGAEAAEAAFKLVRAATGRRGILSTVGGFHGKTLGALSATGREEYQEPFGAPVPGFDFVPFGDLEALEEALRSSGDRYAAFVVEPIQGEGGVHVPPPGYLRAVRDLCTRHGVRLVIDEVQTGLGRTGRMFACEDEGVVPDVLMLSKALGGGLVPIGAVLYGEDVYTERFALLHTSTFAGNTLSCRVALAVLEQLARDGGALARRAAGVGERLKRALGEVAERYPRVVTAVRGRGLLLGLEFGEGAVAGEGQSLLNVLAEQHRLAALVASYLLEVEGVRVAPTVLSSRVLRVEPPLVIDQADCDRLVAAIERTAALVAGGDTAALTNHLLDRPRVLAGGRRAQEPPAEDSGAPTPARASAREDDPGAPAPEASTPSPRWAFLAHAADGDDFRHFDAALAPFSSADLDSLAVRFGALIEPFVAGSARISASGGHTVEGEFVVVPRTAATLRQMSRAEALDEVGAALALAADRGADVVGLGGYLSVVTGAGLDLPDHGVAVTTGNALTAVVAAQAAVDAAGRLGHPAAESTVAVLGAAGSVGRALTLQLARSFGRLVLLGNPNHAARSLRMLRLVAEQVASALAAEPAAAGARDSVADRVAALAGHGDPATIADRLVADGALVLADEAATSLADADLVFTATSSPEVLLHPSWLRPGTVVCDLSRPRNVDRDLQRARTDVLVLDGGLVEVPAASDLGWRFGQPDRIALACMCEPMLLAAQGRPDLAATGVEVPHRLVADLEAWATQHGFRLAPPRSFGREVTDEDWERVAAARPVRPAPVPAPSGKGGS